MAVSREWEAFVLEQLSGLGRVRARRMFGGVGLSLDETFFGLIVGTAGDVYLKVDEANRAAYEAAGSGPFRPFADKAYAMSFWRVPAAVLDDPDEMTAWARAAVGAARRSAVTRKRRAPVKAPAATPTAAPRRRARGATKPLAAIPRGTAKPPPTTPRGVTKPPTTRGTRRTPRTPSPKRG